MVLFDPFGAANGYFAPTATRPAFVPAADVTVSDADLVLTVDLPGLTAGDFTIEVHDGELVLTGERRRPQLGEGTTWAHAERSFGKFERRLRLPDGVDPGAIAASLDDGVLSLIVPKPDKLRRRTIPVTAAPEHSQPEPAPA